MKEEDRIAYWPIIPVTCILNFLIINSDITDPSDHKASKGYSYFKQGWLGKISYRAIVSEHCFLRAGCRPSERLRDGKDFKSPLHLHGRHGFNLQPHSSSSVSCRISYEAGTDKCSMFGKIF